MTRLALVIASQCQAIGHLKNLGAAAEALRDVLLDPDRGACVDAVADQPQPSEAGELSPHDVETTVRHAVARAGELSATLILAFLGHGFSGAGSALYFMCQGSERDVERKSVNVSHLLMLAAVEPHTEGLAAIIDTCYAGTAPPSSRDLIASARGGGKNIAALTAAAADELAYGFRFTTALAEVLRAGVPEVDGACPAHLTVGSVLEPVRRRTPGQVPTEQRFNDAPFSPEPWLALNACHADSDGPRIPRMRTAPAAMLSRNDVLRLVRLLIDIPVVRSLPDAEDLLSRLPGPIPRLVLDPQHRGLDLIHLVRALENYPADDPWRRLLDLLREATPSDKQHLVNDLATACRGLELVG